MDPQAGLRVSVLTHTDVSERYAVIRRIARGGMATVWCAHDRTLERKVAIKVLAGPYAHDELAVRRFRREGRTAARLSGHRNVVTIYDVGQAPASDEAPHGQPFIVMEYLAGGTVADAVRVGEVDRALALRWLREAAAALDYAHERDVVHRDIKLSNFLLDCSRVLHVADFGIASVTTEETLTGSGQVLGTAAYLAPERALGQPASPASDRYALAVAAYELLVGERPFMADHFAALARAQIEDAPPRASERNPELPRALDPVLARGLAKRPEDRYRTGRELVAAIDDALAATAPRRETAMLTSPRTTAAAPAMNVYGGRRSGRPAPPRPSRARGRVVAALLAAAAIAVAAVALSSQSGPSHPASAAHQQTAAKGGRHGSSAPTGSTAVSAAPSESAPSESAPSGSTTAAGSADQLETRGHQLMMAGEYGSAIPVLRQAVSASPRGSLTYAYALYDLGRSLLLAGDPQAAIPILRERLAIPNQTTVVAATLDAALRSARNNGQGGD